MKSFWATFIDIWRLFTGHTEPNLVWNASIVITIIGIAAERLTTFYMFLEWFSFSSFLTFCTFWWAEETTFLCDKLKKIFWLADVLMTTFLSFFLSFFLSISLSSFSLCLTLSVRLYILSTLICLLLYAYFILFLSLTIEQSLSVVFLWSKSFFIFSLS